MTEGGDAGTRNPRLRGPLQAESRPGRAAQQGQHCPRPVRMYGVRWHPAARASVAQHSSHGHLDSNRYPKRGRGDRESCVRLPRNLEPAFLTLSDGHFLPFTMSHPQGPPGCPSSTHPIPRRKDADMQAGLLPGGSGGGGGVVARGERAGYAFSSKGSG